MDGRTEGVGGPGTTDAPAAQAAAIYRFEDFFFLFLVGAYLAGSYAAAFSIGRVGEISPLMYSATVCLVTLFIFLLLFVGYRATWLMFAVRPKRLIRSLVADVRDNYLSRARLLRAIPAIVLLSMFFSVFTSLKNLIPLFHPYDWDSRLHAVDVWLHGGAVPWELMQPLLGYPAVTFAINILYNIWFFVLFLVVYWQVFSMRNPRLRMQFLCTFVLSWLINGTLLAVVFSSAGPCFYQYFVPGDNPYALLMQYLHDADRHYPVWALKAQNYLWSTYQQNSLQLGAGISAMPSVHVSSVVVFALLGLHTSKLLGGVLTAFAVLVFLGSVHLGWHYAVDGYLALLTTAAIWFGVGWFFRRYGSTAQGW